MPRRFTVPINVTAPADSDSFYSLYTVREAHVVAREIELSFESGVHDVLFASLYYGDLKVAPKTSEYTGDSGRVRDIIEVHYYRGDQVKLRVRNTDTANSHYLVGSIELEEVVE